MNIFEQLMYTTIKMVVITKTGITSIGTGFFVERNLSDGKKKIYLVTNRHVIEDASELSLDFCTTFDKRPVIGGIHRINLSEVSGSYVVHPDDNIDIAVLECTGLFVQFPETFYFKAVNMDLFATFSEPELNVAQSIYFIGYPSAIYDTKNNLPIVRTGIIASNPKLDYEGDKKFIIDAQVFPGSSGSPVYIDLTFENIKNGQIVLDENRNIKLLGIVAQTMIRNNELIPLTNNVHLGTQEVLGLGIVFKATAIKELIDSMPTDN